jgi:tRNA (Thr-GGU) A37 N-methylase
MCDHKSEITSAPVQPNLIGLTLCRILEVLDNTIEIDEIDASAGSPILDVKPYFPIHDSVEISIPEGDFQ